MGREYAKIKTALKPAETALHLVDAYTRVMGRAPDRNTAELYLALLWNENARGDSIYNYNWGNVIALGDQDFYRPPWFDQGNIDRVTNEALRKRYQSLHDKMIAKPGTVPSKFRALKQHAEGADRWIQTLKQDRYAGTRQAAALGDAEQFAYYIFSEGYCPDDECSRLGPKYASLRDDIRKQGLLQDLSLANEGSYIAPTQLGYPLRAGHRYRIWETTNMPFDAVALRQNLEHSGATDIEVTQSTPTDAAYAFTTPVMAVDFWHFQPMVPGARIQAVEELAPPTLRRIEKTHSAAPLMIAALTLFGVMLLSRKGA